MAADAPLLILICWIFLLGSVVGSFLNVVIYRLPAGLNIAWPGSHCPLCQHPIRWYDNIPLMGWIVLRGRCRDCRAPIAIRYPLVEATTAALFGVLFFYEVVKHGVNLPLRAAAEGATWTLAELLALWFSHVVLLCTLLVAALIAYDGRRPPLVLFLPTLLAGLSMPWFWPVLHPVPASLRLTSGPWGVFVDSAVGLLVGWLLGSLATWLNRLTLPASPPSRRAAVCDVRGAAVCVGVILGWQAACGVVLLAVAIYQVLRLTLGRHKEIDRIPASAWLALLTLIWVLDWAQLVC
jgi:prepilin signal peptidase PulO-like enzyme (type II secretory pathway)